MLILTIQGWQGRRLQLERLPERQQKLAKQQWLKLHGVEFFEQPGEITPHALLISYAGPYALILLLCCLFLIQFFYFMLLQDPK